MVSNTIYHCCRTIQYSLILSVYNIFYACRVMNLKNLIDSQSIIFSRFVASKAYRHNPNSVLFVRQTSVAGNNGKG